MKGTRRVIAGILSGAVLICGTLAGWIACSRSSVPELEVIPEESSGITLFLSERLLGAPAGTIGTVRMTATATPAGTYSYRWSLTWGTVNPGGAIGSYLTVTPIATGSNVADVTCYARFDGEAILRVELATDASVYATATVRAPLPEEPPKPADELRVMMLGGHVGSYHPLRPATKAAVEWNTLTQLSLVKEQADGTLVADFAERFEVSEDGLDWTFYLRTDVTTSMNEPLTAADAAYTLEQICAGDYAGRYRLPTPVIRGQADYAAGNAESLDGVFYDNEVLQIYLAYPLVNFAEYLQFPILSRSFYETWTEPQLPEDLRGAFCGAYTISEATEEAVTLTANPNYYAGRPQVTTVRYLSVEATQDGAAITDAFLLGDVDVAQLNLFDYEREWSLQFDGKEKVPLGSGGYDYLGISAARIDNLELRTGLAAYLGALRVEDLLDYPGSPLSVSHPEEFHRDDLAAAAEELRMGLENAGMADSGLVWRALCPGYSDGQYFQIFLDLTDALAESGVELTVDYLADRAQYETALESGEYDLWIGRYEDASPYRYGAGNRYGLESAELERLLEALQYPADYAEWEQTLAEIRAVVVENAVEVPLYEVHEFLFLTGSEACSTLNLSTANLSVRYGLAAYLRDLVEV